MCRVVVSAAILVGLLPGVALAKGQKVHIETEPKGANVYLNDKENGSKCTTPCDVEVPVGETSVIIELASYEPIIELVEVKAGKKPPPLSRKLVRSVGTIIVEGAGAAVGAKIVVDGNDTGKVAPAKIDVDAGPHLVTVTSRSGKDLFADSVDVNTNQEVTVTPKQSGGATEVIPKDPERPTDPPAIHETAPAPRGHFLNASVVTDVGFRNFDYADLHGPDPMHPSDQRSHFDEGGQVLLGGQVELYPGQLLGVPFIRGLFLEGRYQFGVNPQQVTGSGTGNTKTFWQCWEASLHHRWVFYPFTVQVGGGYTYDQFAFSGDSSIIDVEPDAEYSAIKLAARISLLLGSVEPYLIGENRIVLDAGPIAARFADSNVTIQGLRGVGGLAAKFGSFDARLEGSYLNYSWKFVTTNTMAMNQASSATDTVMSVNFTLGYSY